MAFKTDWNYLTGDLKVTVKAIRQDGRYRIFYFTCYASDEVKACDRLSALAEAAYALAELRNYHLTELIDIKKVYRTELIDFKKV